MQVRRSLWISFAFSNASTVVFFAVSLILARLLTPDQIGVFSISVVFVNIMSIFRDLGGNPYIVRKAELTNEDTGAVLGLTLTTSWVLAALLWLSTGQIAAFYGDPRIVNVLHILTFNFLLVPPSAVMASVLARNLSAGKGAKVGMAALMAHCAVSLSLAALGWGEQALALANTALLLTNLAGYSLMMPEGFRIKPIWRGWREPLQFSRGILTNNIINMASASIPDLFIGRKLGTHEVGIYSRSNGLTGLFQQVVGPTLGFNTLPVLAKAHHEGKSAFDHMLRKSTELLTGLAWPIYIWLAVFANPVIRVLYGPNWAAAAPLVPWLCLAAIAKVPFSVIGPALQAINRPMSGAWASLPTLGLRILLLAVLPVDTLYAVVVALVVADILALLAWGRVTRKLLDMPLIEMLRSQKRSAMVACACLAACLASKWLCGWVGLPALAELLVSGASLIVAFSASVLMSGHAFKDEILRAFQSLRPKAAANRT
jgi:O-antigen/teichoic acid export membrane protein